ncbi:MAG: hypothetical protein J7K87_00085 [Candidatus Aenigmarchaeota archaeon]|nr:hypothetical protein [Candidatus Aenigmarchaeota archaeon]
MRKNTSILEDIFILIVLLTLMVVSLSLAPLKIYEEKYSYTEFENNILEKSESETFLLLEYTLILILLIIILKIESKKIISKYVKKLVNKVCQNF